MNRFTQRFNAEMNTYLLISLDRITFLTPLCSKNTYYFSSNWGGLTFFLFNWNTRKILNFRRRSLSLSFLKLLSSPASLFCTLSLCRKKKFIIIRDGGLHGICKKCTTSQKICIFFAFSVHLVHFFCIFVHFCAFFGLFQQIHLFTL